MDQHFLIYSHGFGVRKDDNGLLNDVADHLPDFKSVLFDYNEFDEAQNTLTIKPLSVQAEILSNVIEKTRATYPLARIDLICHSQGAIVAALAKPKGITKTIFLAPAFDISIERRLPRYAKKPGAEINLEGISRVPSSNGLIRLIPAEYWRELKDIDPFDLYNSFAEQTELSIVKANQDQIVTSVDLTKLSSKIKVISIDGNHGFGGADRPKLIQTIKDVLG
jgi:hypothetical protein